LQIAAIIPVKKFSKAKTRLGLTQEKTESLCKVMLDEVLSTISQSQRISQIVLVSNDEAVFDIGKRHRVVPIFEENDVGVNAAVSLAEKYLNKNGFETSVVFPQDIPLMKTEDVDMLLGFQKNTKSLLVVPSRKFDGTNALVRTPANVMETHYDEDSYKIHLSTGKSRGITTSFVLIQRIMFDVDDRSDIGYIMDSVEKPQITKRIREILEE
jgi:2-phospho-L-lactate guanylyltransferase